MMAVLSRNCHYHQLCLRLAVTVIFFLSLTCLPSISGGVEAYPRNGEETMRKMILGSRPPGCVNKCMSCRPCEATLVIPPHLISKPNYYEESSTSSSHREDDSYYLLSWKCRCRNKLYQP